MIRQATIFDRERVEALLKEMGLCYMKNGKIEDTSVLNERVNTLYDRIKIEDFYIIEIDNLIIGLLSIWKEEDKTIISNLYISYIFRRKGYGRNLLEYVTKGIDDVVIIVIEHKRDVYKFYKKLGFSICDKEIISNNKLLRFIKKGDGMKIRVITINDKDYLLIDRKDIVDDKELRHILLSMKKSFDFLEENKNLYNCLNNTEYSENVRLDCVKSLLNDKYKDDVVLIKEEDIERIETGICI